MEDLMLRIVALALVTSAACGKHATRPPATGSAGSAVATAPASAPPAGSASGSAVVPHGDDLLSLTSGVMVVDGPGGEEPTAREWAMLDEDPDSGWVREETKAIATPIVIDMAAPARIDSLVIDEAKCDLDSRLVHELDIELSNVSAVAGFKHIAHVKPDRLQDGLVYPVSPGAVGRWLRIVALPRAKPDEGSSEIQIMNLHAYGERLAPVPTPQITGSYDTDLGVFNFTQTGVQVTGCAEHGSKPLLGVLDGRVLRMQYEQDAKSDHGPLVMVFGEQGRVFGAYWNETVERPALLAFDAKRTSATPASCPEDKVDPLAAQLAASGRVRLYGINFDTDKATLRPESKPTLDRVVALLEASKDLRLRIEGHTDDRGTADHNQALSDARAAAVKAALVDAGIDGSRLETQGFGATQPTTTNASELGRAANRRVELVKV